MIDPGEKQRVMKILAQPHYETRRFRDALRQAVPWLREVWK